MVINDLKIGDKVYDRENDCVYEIIAKNSRNCTLEVVERNVVASFNEQYKEKLCQGAEADLLRRKYHSIYGFSL